MLVKRTRGDDVYATFFFLRTAAGSFIAGCDIRDSVFSSFKMDFHFNLQAIQLTQANWGVPGSSQYHIQTDEGPERYFRYQTDNGQFRKEKRLQDGTVIGTNAWIDGSGYLRQSDYIADHQGYRILKSKTVFVGIDRPIEVGSLIACR